MSWRQVFSRRPESTRSLALLLLCLGFVVSGGAWWLLLRAEAEIANERLLSAAQQRQLAFSEELASARAALEDLASFVAYANGLDRQQFSGFVTPILERNTAIRSLSWNPLVGDAERSSFEVAARTGGFPAFRITERDAAEQMATAGRRSEYLPVLWIEPLEETRSAVGFDVLSEGIRRRAAGRARATGEFTVSEPIAISGEAPMEYGVLAFLPVFEYEQPTSVTSPPDSRAAPLRGLIVGVWQIAEVLAAASGRFDEPSVHAEVWDVTEGSGPVRLTGARESAGQMMDHPSGLSHWVGRFGHVDQRLEWGTRTWQIHLSPTASFGDAGTRLLAHVVLIAGLLISILSAAHVWTLSRQRARARALVAKRTRELIEANDRLGEQVREKNLAQRELTEHRQLLEHRVEERTRDLATAIADLRLEVRRRRQAEHDVRRSNERVELALEAISEGMLDWDVPKDQLFVSDRWLLALGYEPELIDARERQELYSSALHPDDLERLNEALLRLLSGQTETLDCEVRRQTKEGTYRWFRDRGKVVERDADGNALRLVGTSRDITEEKRNREEHELLEQRFRQAQKLESLGVLAGGIAHDFNNILVGVMGNADLALSEVEPDSELAELLEGVVLSSRRAAELIHQMLAYTGKAPLASSQIALHDLVGEMLQLLRSSVSKKAELVLDLEKAEVFGDPVQLRQVAMNLLTNASDALGDATGTIRVSTGNTIVTKADLAPALLSESLTAGEFSFLEVSDEGSGMDAATVARVFDPFYTTKVDGRGLGLAATLGIVRGHGGAIQVNSEAGRGTTIRVLFPRAAAAEPGAPIESEAIEEELPLDTLVLVIDDEPAIRQLVTRVVERRGGHIVAAADGASGLEAFRQHATKISVVLLDATMPGMNGAEVLAGIREISDVPVVLTSGYSQFDLRQEKIGNDIAGFLQKPFLSGDLLALVRHALASHGSQANQVGWSDDAGIADSAPGSSLV